MDREKARDGCARGRQRHTQRPRRTKMDRQMGGQMHKQMDRKEGSWMYRQADRPTGGQDSKHV